MMVSRRARFMSALILLGVLIGTMLGGEVLAQEEKKGEIVRTLSGGTFDSYLMLAVDEKGKTLSGYYNDGKCRFIFRDALSPFVQYQRSELGETYVVASWDPAHPDRHFTTTIYSKARNGYRSQLTLEPGYRDENRPKACHDRISLDRAEWVPTNFLEVGVMRKRGARLVPITSPGRKPKPVSRKDRLPPPGVGVWIVRPESPDFCPTGFVYLYWYVPRGTPHDGCVRQKDLYASQPLP
jgi:hypothetical protein